MTAGFNFLEQPELPAPQVSETQAEYLLLKHYGINARAESLGSQQDKNFLVLDSDDRPFGVLKIANPAFTPVELAAQDAAAETIAEAEPTLRVAAPLPNLNGEKCTTVTGLLANSPVASLAPGDPAYVRLLPYLPGGTLVAAGHLSAEVIAGMGGLAGRISRALAGFRHDGLDRVLQWDLRFGRDVVDELAADVDDPSHRERLTAAATEAWQRIEPRADELPRQAVHLDLTDANVVVACSHGATALPDGIIDFGDLSDSWAVSEVAITLSSVLAHPGTTPVSILPGIKAFHAIRPLTAAEADVVWPLLVLRTAVLIVSGAQQARLDPDNDYITDQSDDEWRMFEQATSVPIDVMTAVIRAELGLDTSADAVPGGSLIADLDPASITTLDLAATSEVFDDAFEPGAWLGADVEAELARAAVRAGAALVVTRFGGPRLTRAPALSQHSPEVIATGISLWPAQAVTVTAPWSGDVEHVGGGLVLRSDGYELTVTGVDVTAAGHVEVGAPLATASADHWFEVGLRPAGAPPAPGIHHRRIGARMAGGRPRPGTSARVARVGTRR